MARPERGVKMESRRIHLPASLWAALDTLHNDPAKNKPRYGASSKYFERIVKTDLRRMDKFRQMIDDLNEGETK